MDSKENNNKYYAVIFTSIRNNDDENYDFLFNKLHDSAKKFEGFIDIEFASQEIGITVSYWNSLSSIKNWKENLDHSLVRKLGREKFYSSFSVRICEVLREYSFK